MRRAFAILAVVVAVFGLASPARADDPSTRTTTPIRHFVFLMQGDRTFDNYFGTYPGADGIPAGACQPLVLDRPQSGCVKPFALHGRTPAALEPGQSVITAQFDHGKMDGFVAAYAAQGRDGTEAMGYYDNQDLQYYWNVAARYVLFDRFFSDAPFGYRINRSFWLSAAPPQGSGGAVPTGGYGDLPTIFDRLQAAGVSWKFYVQDYRPDETFRTRSATDPATQTVRVPLLNYARFLDDPRLRSHIVDLDQYYRDLSNGTLPAVAYVASSGASERSGRSIPAGQNLVRGMVTQLMLSPYWSSSAFMWSYDGSGGWYDHVTPPSGYGLRVPALLVSPYARHGHVVHRQLDYTGALAFIEHNWGIAPLTDRDAKATSIASAFDFTAPARPAEIVPATAAKDHPPLVETRIIYWFYGSALVLVLALVGFAVGWSRRARRVPAPAVEHSVPDTVDVPEVPVP